MRRRVTRRDFLQLSGVGATVAATGGLAGILATGRAPAYAQQTTVHWLRWNDFVPASDQLLRNKIAPEAAKALGIKLNVETINANDIQARITSAVQSGTGPDIICALSNWPQLYADSVVDVSDVAEALAGEQGGYWDLFKIVAHDGKKWLGVPWTIVAGLLTNRRSWFAEAGYPEDKFPQTWDEYRAAGKKLKAAGRPFGQTAGHTFGDAPSFWYPFLWSFGGREIADDRKTVVLDSKETVKSVKFAVAFWKECCDEGGLAWDDSNNNRAFLSGTISSTNNGASIYIESKRKPEFVQDHRRKAAQGGYFPHATAERASRPVYLPDADDRYADELFEEPETGQRVPSLGKLEVGIRHMVHLAAGVLYWPDQGLGEGPDVGGRPNHVAVQGCRPNLDPLCRSCRSVEPSRSRSGHQIHYHRYVRQGNPRHGARGIGEMGA